MSGFNLPPGCSVNDIPGNRPEDGVAERLEELFAEAWSYAFTEEQILELWREVCAFEQERADAWERQHG